MIVRTGANDAAAVTLPARPEALRIDPAETAVIVIDMQNAYASPGGYVDLAGFDIKGAAGTIERIAQVLATARTAGVQVVYLQNGWDPDYVEAGGPGSPNWHKSNAFPSGSRSTRPARRSSSRPRSPRGCATRLIRSATGASG